MTHPAERDPYACQVCNCHHHTTEDHASREYVSRLWAEDWDSEEDAVYDAENPPHNNGASGA